MSNDHGDQDRAEIIEQLGKIIEKLDSIDGYLCSTLIEIEKIPKK